MTHDLPTSPSLAGNSLADDAAPRITVVGAGHSMVAQDRVGPRVIELLHERCDDSIDLYNVGTSGLDLLDRFLAQDLMIIVDACIGIGTPGELVEMLPDLDATPTPTASVHQIGPIEALLVAKHLYPEHLPKRVLLMLVETGGIDDKTAEDACHRVVEAVEREIRQVRATTPESATQLAAGAPITSATNDCEKVHPGRG